MTETRERKVEQLRTTEEPVIGYVRNLYGDEQPIYKPIRGFEILFRRERFTTTHDAPEDCPLGCRMEHSFDFGDIKGLRHFLFTRFKEVTLKPLRYIVTAWIHWIQPNRRKIYGAYNSRTNKHESSELPPWWPTTVPYDEPTRLRVQDLALLATEITLVNHGSNVYENQGTSWINELQIIANETIRSMDTMSLAIHEEYEGAMKSLVMEKILPSLFGVAIAHEKYFACNNPGEGSNKAERMPWTHYHLPQRTRPEPQVKKSRVNKSRFKKSQAMKSQKHSHINLSEDNQAFLKPVACHGGVKASRTVVYDQGAPLTLHGFDQSAQPPQVHGSVPVQPLPTNNSDLEIPRPADPIQLSYHVFRDHDSTWACNTSNSRNEMLGLQEGLVRDEEYKGD
ncbi:hypothetical protein N0V90_012833 [Kalmusia sp. IMI 367209]|nr:hypothetical protein N0V90_012833 [Kalmusia sp. IMI 367209]